MFTNVKKKHHKSDQILTLPSLINVEMCAICREEQHDEYRQAISRTFLQNDLQNTVHKEWHNNVSQTVQYNSNRTSFKHEQLQG